MSHIINLPGAGQSGITPDIALKQAALLAAHHAGKRKFGVGGPLTIADQIRLLWLLKVIGAYARKEIPRLQKQIATSAKIRR